MLLLQIQQDTLRTSIEMANSPFIKSIWFWLSLIQFVMIISIIKYYQKKIKDLALDSLGMDLQKAKSSEVNMDDLMQSIAGARELYKSLSKVCHPDRFINDERHPLAEEIFGEISKNKRNFKMLQVLQKRAEIVLKITIK